jgi:hypothetical protein
MNIPESSLRLIPREAEFLNRTTGLRGEIYYDADNNTLRVYPGSATIGIQLARNDLLNVSNAIFYNKAQSAGVLSAGGGGSTTVSVGDAVPNAPSNGNLWLNTNNGILYVYIDDGNSSQWMQPAVPTPALSAVATSNDYEDLDNLPTLSTVAISNSYNDLDDKPTSFSNLSSLSLAIGATINEISSDGTLANNSNTAVPTEAAVKTYVDANITDIGSIEFSGSSIDSADSSAISFVPAVVFNSDVDIENDLFVDNVTTSPTVITNRISSIGQILTIAASTVNVSAFGLTSEKVNLISNAENTVVHDLSEGALWYHTTPTNNFTVNFTNVPTVNNRSISVVLIIDQGGTAYVPIDLEIDGTQRTVLWVGGGGVPAGNANQVDVVSYTLIYVGSSWQILASLSTYD